jgi:hypothetical protein
MIPDRTRVQPIGELLQRFYGCKFISTIDLASAFLQVELEPESRKYTAFVFEWQMYEYNRVPFGFKNALSAFVRALNMTLGPETSDYTLCYVDNLIIYSTSFELHLQHLDIVLDKLTSAGFTVNAKKSYFCRPEITFLGHISLKVKVWLVNADLCEQNVLCIVNVCVHGMGVGSVKYVTRPT